MTATTQSYIASIAIFFPLITVVVRKKYLSKELKILFLYLISSTIDEVLGNVWAKVLHLPNHFIINTFATLECILISLIFYEIFIAKDLKRIVLVSIGIYVLICIYVFTILDNFYRFSSIINTVSCLLIIVWVFTYFYQLLQIPQLIKLYALPMFWISVGCLLYFSGTLFIFLYSEKILFQKEPILYKQLWTIYYVLLFIFRVLLAIGLWFSKTSFQLSKSFSN